MGNTYIEETGARRKPSAGAAVFDGTVNPRGGEERPQGLTQSLRWPPPVNAVFPDPAAQGAGIETEEYRRPGFPLDSPAGFLEHLADVVALHLAKRLDEMERDHISRS